MFVHVCNRREDGANAAIDTSETEDDESLVGSGSRAGIESGKNAAEAGALETHER